MKSLTIITPSKIPSLETKRNQTPNEHQLPLLQLNNSIVTFPKFATPNARILSDTDRRVRGNLPLSFQEQEQEGLRSLVS